MPKKPFVVILVGLSLAVMACGLFSRTESLSEAGGISGDQVFRDSGCSGCHEGAAGIAPSLDGLYGEEVVLESGETVIADEEYLKESILDPKAKAVQGYQPVMPDFQNLLSEAEVEALVAYIVSLDD